MDARTDVWAVGVMLYHCVVGAPPFGKVADDSPHRSSVSFSPSLCLAFPRSRGCPACEGSGKPAALGAA